MQKEKKTKSKYIAGTIVKKSIGYRMLLPAIAAFMVVQVIPFFYGVIMSFTDKRIIGPQANNPMQFIGLENYNNILFDKWLAADFYQVFGFTMLYTVTVIFFSYLVGMFFAVLLNRNMKFRNLFRALAFLPWFVNPMVVSVCWSIMLNPSESGFMNMLMLMFNIIKEPLVWRGDAILAKISVMIIGVWQAYPMMMVMLLSGMQGIDQSIYEPATIAGANALQKFRHITLPLLRPLTLTVMGLQFIWTFGSNSYSTIMTFTAGGPVRETYVLTIEVMNQAFYRGKMGYAAAIALMMMLFLGCVALIALIFRRFYRRYEAKKYA